MQELKASVPSSLDSAEVEPSRVLSMGWKCPPDPWMLGRGEEVAAGLWEL